MASEIAACMIVAEKQFCHAARGAERPGPTVSV
jgi:hypothetical protein